VTPRTIYAACLARLGLSQPEAAALHGVRPDTVKSWSAGRNPVPERIYDELREYAAQIAERSDAMMDLWHREKPDEVELTVAHEPIAMMAAADFALRLPVGVRLRTG
jgi:hypothetical protein